MSEPFAIRAAVVVLEARAPVLRDGAVIVADGRIQAVGPETEALADHPHARDGGRFDMVLPGLIDAHSHARGAPLEWHGCGGGPLERFLCDLTAMTPLYAGDEALVAAVDQLGGGITAVQPIVHSFEDPDRYAGTVRSIASAYERSGLRAGLALGFTDQDEYVPGQEPLVAPHQMTAAEFGALVPRLLRQDSRVTIDAAGPVAPQWCTEAALAATGGAPRVHTHLLESASQRFAPDGDPLDRLETAGLLSPATSVAHGVWLDRDHGERLARAGVVVVHNPGSNTLIGVGTCPVARLRRQGVTVAMGLDSHTPLHPPDAFVEMRRARALAAAAGDPLSERDVLDMATLGGAAALVRSDLGRIAAGACADLVALRLQVALHVDDPVTAMVATATRDAIAAAWVEGERVLPLAPELHAEVESARERLRAALRSDASDRARRLAAVDALWPRVRGAYESMIPA